MISMIMIVLKLYLENVMIGENLEAQIRFKIQKQMRLMTRIHSQRNFQSAWNFQLLNKLPVN